MDEREASSSRSADCGDGHILPCVLVYNDEKIV